MIVRPTPRSLVVCEQVVPDAMKPNRLSLLRVIHAITPKRGSDYPLIQSELCVFAQLTEGRGEGQLRVEIHNADSDDVLFRTRSRLIRFPENDPLRIHGVKFQILGLVFRVPGLYWFQLWFDDFNLIQTPIVLRPPASSSQ